ncbi:hypothetical protein ABL78_3492 [Leptomonas seymouri]|uniref:Kinesin motor domain-containing protein n=1 Tax=Leptomonas seymouri TaxID=5684 RepID=A0A0N1PCQ4_LEPSE|nr:hypothetical protein ABL78_3492 [Leptomonas seymouri]|eukprot:KPI87408.1 hypothetical protein ABL78_3492 [Leptomonas seymouri]
MSVRTYCVIPHCAREDTNFFQGVFEDGVRVLYQGRLQSLLFSHVLSPAHAYVKHINGPLLASLREGGNATLLVATPNSEHVSSSSAAAATSPATAASSSPSKCEGIAEITSTTMGLYRQLFPLLFRNLERCATARLSVVTVSALDRVLLDNLQDDRRIRDVTEAHHLTLHRRTSAAEWGALLQLLEERHIAMENSTTSLEGQTACVVAVDLDGYGRLVVVDTASSQELLQQLSLILGMGEEGNRRTYPPHTPLRDLLARNVTPQATVQVVCLPAPQDTARQTMRVLHFGSAVEVWRSKGVSTGCSSSRDGASRSYGLSFTGTADEESGVTRGPSKLFSRSAVSPSVSVDVDRKHHRIDDAEGLDNVGDDSVRGSGEPSRNPRLAANAVERSENTDTTSSSGPALESAPQRYTGHTELSRSTINTSSHYGEATPAQLPPPTVATARNEQQRAREERLRRRVSVLEAQLKDIEATNQSLKAARDEAVRARESVELERRSKSSMWADLQRAHSKTKQENADYAQLVQKLLQQVRSLERDTSRQKRQNMSAVKELRQLREDKDALEAQLTRLRKEVMLFRRDATYRAREATLSRIVSSEISMPPHGSARAAVEASTLSSTAAPAAFAGKGRGKGSAAPRGSSKRRSSPRARRLYDTSTDDEERGNRLINADGGDNAEGAAEHDPARHLDPSQLPSAQSQRATNITLEELRWRNRHLELEVARLQERLLGALTSAGAPPSGQPASSSPAPPLAGDDLLSTTCHKCDAMRERVEYFYKELAHARAEKDRLLDLLEASRAQGASSLEIHRLAHDRDTASEASAEVRVEMGAGGGRESGPMDNEGAGHARRNGSALNAPTAHRRPSFSFSFSPTESSTTRDVAAALLTGCASLQAQLECAQTALRQRLRSAQSSDVASRTDPLSHISAQVLAEHYDAVAALAESLRNIAEKPATISLPLASVSHHNRSHSGDDSARQQLLLLPPVPRTATAGNAEALTPYLTFEAERCRHLCAFVPTFAQLAVATEHLLMRLEATEPERRE